MKAVATSLQLHAALLILTAVFIHACSNGRFLPLTQRSGIYHTVKKGQTFWRICKTYGVEPSKIAEINKIKDTSRIMAGDRLFIPGAKKQLYVPPVKNAAAKPPAQQKPADARPPSRISFTWPVQGKIVKSYGTTGGIRHDGINIRADAGTPVKASASGKVIFSDILPGYGNTVIIEHRDSYATVYANNNDNLVTKHEKVNRYQHIARVGSSGDPASPPHLHFQIRRYNRSRNPLLYLPH